MCRGPDYSRILLAACLVFGRVLWSRDWEIGGNWSCGGEAFMDTSEVLWGCRTGQRDHHGRWRFAGEKGRDAQLHSWLWEHGALQHSVLCNVEMYGFIAATACVEQTKDWYQGTWTCRAAPPWGQGNCLCFTGHKLCHRNGVHAGGPKLERKAVWDSACPQYETLLEFELKKRTVKTSKRAVEEKRRLSDACWWQPVQTCLWFFQQHHIKSFSFAWEAAFVRW